MTGTLADVIEELIEARRAGEQLRPIDPVVVRTAGGEYELVSALHELGDEDTTTDADALADILYSASGTGTAAEEARALAKSMEGSDWLRDLFADWNEAD